MNTPNKITIMRIALIPLVVFFYLATFIPWHVFIAGVLFVIATITDFFDGYLARKNNQVTDIGKFLDAIADKMLVSAALILIVAFPIVLSNNNMLSVVKPQWLGIVFVVLILAREFAVSALRMVAASKGKVLPADKSGKVKAAVTFVTLALYFFFAFYLSEFYVPGVKGHETANTIISIVLIVLFGISTLLTISSGYNYFVNNGNVFRTETVSAKVSQIASESKPVIKSQMQRKTQSKAKAVSKSQTSSAKQNVNNDKRGRAFDELIPQALDMFCEKGWASTTMLQKHLGVGYPRASKIVDQMEELGLISSGDGLKTRKVLVTKEEYQRKFKQK